MCNTVLCEFYDYTKHTNFKKIQGENVYTSMLVFNINSEVV